MDYSKDIIDVLMRAPEGLTIRKIVRHVYNAHNTLFESADLEDVKRSVTMYLTTRSKTKSSPIQHTGQWGAYRLNPNSDFFRQMSLQFSDEEEEEQYPSSATTLNTPQELDLFGPNP